MKRHKTSFDEVVKNLDPMRVFQIKQPHERLQTQNGLSNNSKTCSSPNDGYLLHSRLENE